jgi:TolB protein
LRARIAFGAAALATATAIVWATAAQATFPGDNGRIIYAAKPFHQTANVFSISPSGGTPKQLTDGTRDALDPAVSADGKQVVYVGSPTQHTDELFSVSADGGKPTQLTDLPDLFKSKPSFSPDGDQIVFEASEDIWVVNTDGTDAHAVITGATDQTDPMFSPDGSRILFTTLGPNGGTTNLVDAKVDGSDQRQLTARYEDKAKSLFFLYFQDPDYSPDGKRIILTTDLYGAKHDDLSGQIATMNADGSKLKRLFKSSHSEGEPIFSPDGKRICFRRFEEGKLLTASAKGRHIEDIADIRNDSKAGSATWQPAP